jgi:hypothetical protein
LSNSKGQFVKNWKRQDEEITVLNIEDLPHGLYVLSIKIGKYFYMEKVIIQ